MTRGMKNRITKLAVVGSLASAVAAQTYSRSAACPGLGCIYPPDQTEFLAGQVFDIRVEVQAPVNGSMPYNGGVPNPDWSLTIARAEDGSDRQSVSDFYNVEAPTVDSYNFTYYEDLFAKDNSSATLVNVLSSDWKHVTLYNPGEYHLKLKYNGGMETLAKWTVLPLSEKKCAKNVILMIGDGMAPSMVTAARMIGHKTINGKYQTHMALDKPDGFGFQMTHSLDSYITDSANSATALMAGKKSTVNALNVYTDSTGNAFGPKFETIFEMGRRIYGAQIGIVSTAYLADATPAATVTHTSQRGQYDYIIDQFLGGIRNESWTHWDGPDVLFGGGGSDFIAKESNNNVSKIAQFQEKGYEFVTTNSSLHEIGNDERALGLFSASTMPTWIDRHIFKQNLESKFGAYDSENGTFTAPVTDSPGLKEMTIKAIDILSTRAKKNNVPFMLMSEAASIDKAMHVGDMERAMGELLELDNTVKTVLAHLEKLGLKDDTLVVVTADHGHGFDVFGSVDTVYLSAQSTNAGKRAAIGTYRESGLSGYQVRPNDNPQNQTIVAENDGFPATWSPRYTAAWGFAATVDSFQNYQIHNTTRKTSIENEDGSYTADEADSPGGFFISGDLPVENDQGVHSLTDVPVYSWGPGADKFRGILNSPDIAHHIALALDLAKDKNVTYSAPSSSSSSASRSKVKL